MSNSMMESLIFGLPDWTTNTSFSRTLVKILTLVSPLNVLAGTGTSIGKSYSGREKQELWESHIGELC